MAISYNRLWKLLIDKDLKKTDLVKLACVSSNVIASLGQNKNVSLDSLEKICTSLNCNIEDIMEFIRTEDKDKNRDGELEYGLQKTTEKD